MTKVKQIIQVEDTEQQCISVDSKDHLYITDDDIVTMNTVVSGTMSELAFFTDAGKSPEYIMRFFNDLKLRVESRMKGNYFGRTILDSSPNDIENPIDKYASFEAAKNPKNYVVKGSRWEWCPEDYKNLSDTFPVFRGGNGKPPMILSSATGFDSSDIVWVPSEIRQFFEDDLVKSLKDIAGIPSGSLDKLFYDHSKIERVFHDQLKSINTCVRADARSIPYNLIWNEVKDQLFHKDGDKYSFYYKPHLPRVFHIDQAISGDMAAIAVAHAERKPTTLSPLLSGAGFDPNRDIMYVVDFVVPIHPYNGRINLDAIKEFIMDLITLGRVPIVQGSFDTFQSEANIQALARFGIEMENMSVDKSMDPYLFLAQCVEQNSIRVGKNLIFKNNLKSLRVVPRKESGSLKIDHTLGDTIHPGGADWAWDTGLIGINAKDVSDAVCGAVYQAKKYLAIDGRSLSSIWDDKEVVLTVEQKRDRVDQLKKIMGL